MSQAQTRFSAQMKGERSLAPFIPYSSHIAPTTIITKDGDFVRIWRVDGIPHETADPGDIQQRMDQLNMVYRSIGSSQVSIWTHNVRRKITDRLVSEFPDQFSRDLDKKYYDAFSGYRMMANELYFTLVYRPTTNGVERAAMKAARRDVATIIEDRKAGIRKLDELAFQVEAGMRRYGLTVLGVYTDEQGAQCSTALEFLNFLISGEFQKVRLPKGPLDTYLGTSYVFVGAETIEIRGADHRRFAQFIDFKDYPEYSETGLLNDLMYEKFEYVMTHSFSFMGKTEAQKFLKKQQNQLRASEDGSATQIGEIDEAIDELTQGRFCMGSYHFSLLVFSNDLAGLDRNVASAMSVIKDRGFLASLIATATDAAFYAQLPCNWAYRPRVAGITSLNFAGLACMHNFEAGKRDNNPWGQAVTLLKTPSLQPLYFNFHGAKDDEDAFDKKLLGNTRIIGQSGSGKTVLMGMLLSQSQKYKVNAPQGFASVFFDKDRGAELAIRAMGGKYLALKNGQPTGFNPLQMEPNERNILFLESWIANLCRGEPDVIGNFERITASEEARISHAVRTVMRMPRELRSLSTVSQNMTEGVSREERENSLVKRLAKWCRGGQLGWVADNGDDQLDFTTHTSFGFDGTAFLDNKIVRTPISSYLLHRMEEIIDGRRFIYFMDEAWKWVDDDAFSDFAGDKQLTIRKQNGLGVFATQMPSSLLKSRIGSALVQQCATEIYLPNPKADHDEYVKGFKVTEAEFELIREFQEDSRLFIVKQGHRSAVARLDLDGFDDELAILSGSTDNIELLDQVLADVGDDPAVWLPVFHERRKARVSVSKTSFR
jgi:type IV secretion/conjugal transfer VirB4 family ATPase